MPADVRDWQTFVSNASKILVNEKSHRCLTFHICLLPLTPANPIAIADWQYRRFGIFFHGGLFRLNG